MDFVVSFWLPNNVNMDHIFETKVCIDSSFEGFECSFHKVFICRGDFDNLADHALDLFDEFFLLEGWCDGVDVLDGNGVLICGLVFVGCIVQDDPTSAVTVNGDL